MKKKTLHIKLTNLQLKNPQHLHKTYYSFLYNDQFYFSSYFDNQSQSQNLNDDIIIPLISQSNNSQYQNSPKSQEHQSSNNYNNVPQNILVQRWQNHMVMFTHQLDLTQLKSKNFVKKIVEMRQGQILHFSVKLVDSQQLAFSKNYVKNVGQHYIKVRGLQLKQAKRRGDPGPSFFEIVTSCCKSILPVTNGTFVLQVPDKIRFLHYRNGQLYGKTETISTSDLKLSNTQLQIFGNNKSVGQIKMQLQWGINLQKNKTENNYLIDSHQVLLYDFQVKFQNFNEFNNSKLKIIYGNKSFELIGDYNSKILRFKRIIHFIMKSQDQEISILIQKNSKVFAICKFFTDQLIPFKVNNVKKQITTGRVLATVKFKAQKAKNLSVPQNNILWKQLSKKKATNVNFILAVQQISVRYNIRDDILVSFKTDQKEQIFAPVSNISFFQIQNPDYDHERVLLPVKPQQSIYIMIRRHQLQKRKNAQIDENDFIGIAVLNHNLLRLGKNAVQIPFFKNQEQTAIANFIINKIPPFPFIKGLFQPQIITMSNAKMIGVNLFINKIVLTPYYFSYKYDGKNQLYCIVQVNRIKKVLILDQSQHDHLTLICASGSDTLEFLIQQQDYIKIRFVFMISDVGQDQQIYATSFVKCKTSDLFQQLGMDFHNIEMKNDQKNNVGYINLQLHRGVADLTRDKVEYKDQLKRVNNQISKVNESVQFLQKSFQKPKNYRGSTENALQNSPTRIRKRQRKNNSQSKNRYTQNKNQTSMSKESSRINLPVIKNQKKQQKRLQQMLSNMKVRKRVMGGVYQQPQSTTSKIFEYGNSKIGNNNNYQKPINNNKFNINEIHKTNPNLQRNFQILFPKKPDQKKAINPRQRNIHYIDNQNRLKGMKSVMNQISNDIGQVQPTVSKSSRDKNRMNDIDAYMGDEALSKDLAPQWQGNQFAMGKV